MLKKCSRLQPTQNGRPLVLGKKIALKLLAALRPAVGEVIEEHHADTPKNELLSEGSFPNH